MEILGQRIRELREERFMYQDTLAAAIGVSKNSIYNYENGKRLPDAGVLVALADFFSVSPDYLLGKSDFKTQEEIAALYKKETELDNLMNHESPSTIDLIAIFGMISDMFQALHDADMSVADSFLQDLFELLRCVDRCCKDAETITDDIFNGQYAFLDDGYDDDYGFDLFAGEVLDLSVSQKEKATALLSKILDNIRHETIERLADYFGIKSQNSSRTRKLDQIFDKIKERKIQGGEKNGNSKSEKE